MTAKENIERLVKDSISPYKENKRKISEISTDIEIVEKTHGRRRINLNSFASSRMILAIIIVYIILGIAFLAR